MYSKTRRTGTVQHNKRIQLENNNNENHFLVLCSIQENPETSSRKIARNLEIADRTVRNIIKKYHYHDYKFTRVLKLRTTDYERRLTFCHWMMEKLTRDQLFARKILWTDETRFTNCGMFNRRNKHYYATENPNAFQEVRPQERFSLNVWCGIVNDTIIGPFYIDGNLDANKYLLFLRHNLENLLENLPLSTFRHIEYLQQDGCAAHNARNVHTYLNQRFGSNWIGTNGPVKWPPRSPCLNPLDYFLWGHLKDSIYYSPVNSVDELIRRIDNTIHNIPSQVVQNAVDDIKRRVRLCLQQRGRQFEQLL